MRSTLVRRIRDGRALALTLDPAALRARLQEVDALQTHLRRIPSRHAPCRRARAPSPRRSPRQQWCAGAEGHRSSASCGRRWPAYQRRDPRSAGRDGCPRWFLRRPPAKLPAPR